VTPGVFHLGATQQRLPVQSHPAAQDFADKVRSYDIEIDGAAL